MYRLLLFLVWMLGSLAPIHVSFAEEPLDVIWVVPAIKPTAWQPLTLERREGHIRGLNATTVTWESKIALTPQDSQRRADQPPSGQTEAKTADLQIERVVRWQIAPDSAAETLAIEKELSGEPREAARQWLIAATQYKTQTTLWRRLYLIAQSWQSLYTAKEYGALFDVIKQNPFADRVPIFMAQLPMIWTRETLPDSALVVAKEQLASPSPALQIVAASWLLESSESEAAVAVLTKMSTRKDLPGIAKLAEAQLWRLVPADEAASHEAAWKEKVYRLAPAIQAGPMIAIANQQIASKRSDQAVETMLTAVLLYNQPASAIQPARQSALKLLRELGRDADADAFERNRP